MQEGKHRGQTGATDATDTFGGPSGLGDGQILWQACINQLAQELPEQQFNTWIKPLSALVLDDLSKVTILVANRFKLDWVRAQYSGRISALLEKLYGQAIVVELALAPRDAAVRSYAAARGVELVPVEEPTELGEEPNFFSKSCSVMFWI